MSTRGNRGGRGGDRGGRGGDGGGRGGSGAPGAPGAGGGAGRESEAPRGDGLQGGPPRGEPSSFGGGGRGGFGDGPVPLIFAANQPAQIDERLSTADQLVASFRTLAVNNELPLRPDYGTLGKAIILRANFFAVKLPKGPLYDYYLEISPKTNIKRLKARILTLLEQSPECQPHVGSIAHDRSERLVSKKKLPQPLDVVVPFYEEGESGLQPGGRVYTISIKLVRILSSEELDKYQAGKPEFRNYDPQPLISALNIVLQTQATKNGIRIGRNRYFFRTPDMQKLELSMGVEALRGYFASMRPTYKQLMVNVNVYTTAFYTPGNLGDAINALQRTSHGGMPRHFLRGLKVTITHLGYKGKRLKRICSKNAQQQTFPHESWGTISVETYFRQKYNIRLKRPELPVVDISGMNAIQPNYVPAELCEIEAGLPYLGKLDGNETANMTKFACQKPGVNADAIVNHGLPLLGMGPVLPTTSGFTINIGAEMTVIPARELPAPRLIYRVGKANVRDGSWNILDVKFHRGGTVATWWVMVVRDGPDSMIQKPDDPRLTGLIEGFKRKCLNSGIQVLTDARLMAVVLEDPGRDPNRVASIDKIQQVIKKQLVIDKKKPSFILVLLSNVDNYIYPGIKRIGDVEIGVHTIHMQLKKALCHERVQDQYFSNAVLKLNTKLGGINHMLDADSMKWLTNNKTMIVGMDVTHPGPGSIKGTPSIAAVVASVDDSFVQFPASMRVQTSKVEMIQELNQMMIERLQMYQKTNKYLPERVYVYRSGVCESQIHIVLHEELPQILESFWNISPKVVYRPKLTIIICGKRHHARFYATTDTAADRNGNTRPGTVVDQGVTDVFGFDFYLQAHAGLQGTVRPTHYTVVYDENKLGADEVQQGTHCASYLYARATKAVSLVPAAYYADLACKRGRCYINEFLNPADQTTESGNVPTGAARGSGPVWGRGEIDEDGERERAYNSAVDMWGQGLHKSVKDTMFYI